MMVPFSGRNEKVVIVKDELPNTPLIIQSRHLIGYTPGTALTETFSGRESVKRVDTAVITRAKTSPASKHAGSRDSRKQSHRTPSVRRVEAIQIFDDWSRPGEINFISMTAGNTFYLLQPLMELAAGIGNFNESLFPFMNDDQVDFGVMVQQILCCAGCVVPAGYYREMG